ncbi:secreted RxLR effector protein 161-like [Belonocnema kinseyi]|uniref:secreted RxLR effector protein 161-like n=1 Tax=Belonocnema kinseyi TaxID=2817044 RepID=UPI00143DBB2A|nr:secreted RxLR effector protein 161-like [Belonocnema kinseyi]
MNDANAVCVPADLNVNLCQVEDQEKECKNVPFREAVGSLIFLATVSRPDIAYSVNVVSRYLNKHDDSHWQAVKLIYKYLVGTVGLGTEYRSGGSESQLIGFTDADYVSDRDTRRSVTGYAFNLANGLVTWSSQRQKLVTPSTTEAEYVAAAAAAKEALWLRSLLNDIGCRCERAIRLVKTQNITSTPNISTSGIILSEKNLRKMKFLLIMFRHLCSV